MDNRAVSEIISNILRHYYKADILDDNKICEMAFRLQTPSDSNFVKTMNTEPAAIADSSSRLWAVVAG